MRDSDVELEEPEYRPRPKWPIAVLLLVVLGGGGGWFLWKTLTAPDPLKVLVAIDLSGQWYDGSKPAARLVDALNEQLGTLGFETVSGGDPAVLKVLEDAQGDLVKAARSLKASYIVGGRVDVEVIQHPVADGYHEVRALGRITVQHVDDAAPRTLEAATWSGARDRDDALMLLASGVFAQKIGAVVVPALVEHPILAPRLRGGGDNQQLDAKIVARLQKADVYVQNRNRALSTASKAYAAYKLRRQEGEKGPVPVVYHGTGAEQDGLIGVGPEGFLVKTADEELYVNPDSAALRRLDSMETLAWKRSDDTGSVLRTLWTGYNIYSYPGANADGQVAGLVEDLFGWAKTVTLIHDGKSDRLKLDPKHRYSNLTPSPGGKAVAFYDRACRRCEDMLVVLDQAGQERFTAHREGGRFEGYAWLDDNRLLVMHTPPALVQDVQPEGDEEEANPEAEAAAPPTKMFDAVAQTLWLLDLRATPVVPQSLYVVDEGVDLEWVRASHDGSHVAFSARDPGGPAIAVLEIDSRVMQFHHTPGPTEAPTFSPDGSKVAFNVWTDSRSPEVAWVATTGGEIHVLTHNIWDDRYPHFSHDGHRIFFEARGDDPNFPGKRSTAMIASVPVQP